MSRRSRIPREASGSGCMIIWLPASIATIGGFVYLIW